MRTFIAALALLALAGCTTGRDFQRPALDAFSLGRTTRADIVAAYGQPREEASQTVTQPPARPAAEPENRLNAAAVAGSFRRLVYTFQDRSEAMWVAYGIRNKFLVCVFWNDTLVSYDYSSDFKPDSTDFEASIAQSLKPGQSTRQDVLARLGEPTGRAVYPAVLRQDDEKWYYFFYGRKEDRLHKKLLEVLFGPDGVVADFRVGEESGPAPRLAPAPATVPIFIPTK